MKQDTKDLIITQVIPLLLLVAIIVYMIADAYY